jgi:hypothetical protein
MFVTNISLFAIAFCDSIQHFEINDTPELHDGVFSDKDSDDDRLASVKTTFRRKCPTGLGYMIQTNQQHQQYNHVHGSRYLSRRPVP